MAPSREEVVETLQRLREAVRHEPCWTCDCLQGLLTQLELDAEEDVTDLTSDLKVSRERMHGCLGCDPCPSGALYADYLRTCNDRKRERK
jgi:hypothetical protein